MAKRNKSPYPTLGILYDLVTGDEDARVCKDIPESACRHQPRNFFAYLVANFLGKVADELSSARLVLPWLFATLGAPAGFVGFLVPIREAGVLLPQLAVAAYIRRLARRKVVWLLGAALSAAALFCMAVASSTLSGPQAGWALLALVTLFSLARGLCSVSAKDVLGKTVSKTRRGVLMGYSAAAAGVVTLALGLVIEVERLDAAGTGFFVTLLYLAALAWVVALVVFAMIREQPGATEDGGNAITEGIKSLSLLRTDPLFRHYVIARVLLLSLALAPPFYVLVIQQSGAGAGLGLLIIASGLGSALSAPLWGRMGDRSSKWVMISAAAAAGLLGIGVWLLDLVDSPWLDNNMVHALLFLLVIMFHSGVRLGRKLYLVDMASEDNRAAYVAVSNTVIGVAMLAAGGIGILANFVSYSAVIAVLGAISLLAAVYILRLDDVSG